MKRKFVSFFLAMVMAVSYTVPAMAADVTADEVDSNESATLIAEPNEFAEEEASPASAVQYLWKAAFMATKWAVVKADNALFNRDPQIINPGGNWVASSSGNGDDDARRVKFTIFVTDVVTDLKYDESTNITKLYFGNTTDGSFSWPFAGDLRSQINVNDELTFEFSVVEEYATDEYSFETLDYFLESYDLIAEGTAANIQDYLVG